ncbi:SdpI family protein [Ornithobacterium rhinotracheale]|uniref:SdpI family protein n=1 Tax=Ornithobacterium rhinotracheale TaxID=28251 RepID=UPI001FF6550E|nr:SdpI family protein [Ornithobacterium rhinotracheale]MCK0200176.1 SdpI family protein [Ornithobacterium rhinotracheale]UVD87615.1 SdpI family protein [Ornithobacterium rhinotracheale]
MIKYLLIFDFALVGLPLLMYLFPPKELNAIYGYRTKRASRDQASWDFAQRYALKRLLIVALIALFSQFILLIAGFSYKDEPPLIFLIPLGLFILGSFIMIYKTEMALIKFQKKPDQENENNNIK